MLQNWTETLSNNRKAAGQLAAHNPQMLTAFRALNEAQGATGTLDAKTRELIAMAVPSASASSASVTPALRAAAA